MSVSASMAFPLFRVGIAGSALFESGEAYSAFLNASCAKLYNPRFQIEKS